MSTSRVERLQSVPHQHGIAEKPADRADSLPQPLTSLVGRESETAAVLDLLRREDVRLVTLTGPGGIGKTRLALRVAEVGRSGWPDGVWFVPLAPVQELAAVASAIAQVLDLRESGQRPVTEEIKAFLHIGQALLVLDNFEHLLEAAPLVTDLLAGCRGLKILVTSRSLLRVSGEHDFPVPSLSLPNPADATLASRVGWSEAVRLFVARTRAVQPDFKLSDANAAHVAAICRRLDGLPLAIELAAARVRHVPLPVLLARLEQRLPLLTGGPRDQPARQRTLRDAIAWSYDLLAPEEQGLFRRLSVFAGGCTLEGATAVAGRGTGEGGRGMGHTGAPAPQPLPPVPLDVLDGLAALVDHSLLRQVDGPAGEPRFAMLETIREFALEQLDAHGEGESTRWRHTTWCLGLAERSWEALIHRTEVVGWLNRMEAEHANVRAALAWLAQRGDAETGLRLAGALWSFWYFRSHLTEGRAWLGRMLERTSAASAAVRANALVGAGMLAHYQGDDGQAVPLLEQGLALSRAGVKPQLTAFGFYMLGVVAEDRGAYDEAAPRFEEALVLFQEGGNEAFAALARYHLGVVAYGRGDHLRAIALLEDASARLRELGDDWGAAVALDYLGYVAVDQGDATRAAACFAETLPLHRAVGSGEIFASWLCGVATLAAGRGRLEQAARLFAAADALSLTVDYSASLPEAALFDRVRETIRAELGEQRFADAQAVGRALTLEQATEAAGQVLFPEPSPVGNAAQGKRSSEYGLTPRELDVLRLVAAGRTDREIADGLFISPRTASKHVASILAKLEVASRAEAAVVAVRAGLA